MQQLPLLREYTAQPHTVTLKDEGTEMVSPVLDDLRKKQERLERDVKLLKYLFTRRA